MSCPYRHHPTCGPWLLYKHIPRYVCLRVPLLVLAEEHHFRFSNMAALSLKGSMRIALRQKAGKALKRHLLKIRSVMGK